MLTLPGIGHLLRCPLLSLEELLDSLGLTGHFLSLERMLFRRRPRYQTAPALQRLLLHSPWVLVLPFSLGVSHPHTDDDGSSSPTSLRQYPKPPPEGSRDQPCADYRSRCRASACHRGPQRWGWGKRRAECLLVWEEISIGGLEGDTKAMRTVWEGKDVLGHRALGFTYTPNCVSTPPSALTHPLQPPSSP